MRSIDFTQHIALTPAEFLTRLGSEEAFDGQTAQIEGSPEKGFDIRASAPLRDEDVPAAAAAMLPAGAAVQQRLRTSAADAEPVTIDIAAEVSGAPVSLTGRIEVAGQEQGSLATVHAEVTSNAPLFGGMVESAVAPAVERLLRERIEQA